MSCKNLWSRERLPDFLVGKLPDAEVEKVRRHLESCPDCREEYHLLESMAAVEVPDPGRRFWDTLPRMVRVDIEDRKREMEKQPPIFLRPSWLAGMAAAAVAAVVLLAILLRPGPGGPDSDNLLAFLPSRKVVPTGLETEILTGGAAVTFDDLEQIASVDPDLMGGGVIGQDPFLPAGWEYLDLSSDSLQQLENYVDESFHNS